ncbi:MAG: hypothetical protein AB1599_03580 [Planctomycetota bacterium]
MAEVGSELQSVDSSKLAVGSVNTEKLQNGSVTAEKLAAGIGAGIQITWLPTRIQLTSLIISGNQVWQPSAPNPAIPPEATALIMQIELVQQSIPPAPRCNPAGVLRDWRGSKECRPGLWRTGDCAHRGRVI